MWSASPSSRGVLPEVADSTTRTSSRRAAPRPSTISPASRMDARRGARSCPAWEYPGRSASASRAKCGSPTSRRRPGPLMFVGRPREQRATDAGEARRLLLRQRAAVSTLAPLFVPGEHLGGRDREAWLPMRAEDPSHVRECPYRTVRVARLAIFRAELAAAARVRHGCSATKYVVLRAIDAPLAEAPRAGRGGIRPVEADGGGARVTSRQPGRELRELVAPAFCVKRREDHAGRAVDQAGRRSSGGEPPDILRASPARPRDRWPHGGCGRRACGSRC
jgi:hypothetical protein